MRRGEGLGSCGNQSRPTAPERDKMASFRRFCGADALVCAGPSGPARLEEACRFSFRKLPISISRGASRSSRISLRPCGKSGYVGGDFMTTQLGRSEMGSFLIPSISIHGVNNPPLAASICQCRMASFRHLMLSAVELATQPVRAQDSSPRRKPFGNPVSEG